MQNQNKVVYLYQQKQTNMKSQVFFFTADSSLNIVTLIHNDMDDKFKCHGAGKKAFDRAMDEVEPNESVYQVKITATGAELLFTY